MEEQENLPQHQERSSGEEWDTDLESDDLPNKTQSLSCAELYLQACQQAGTFPVSSFLSHLGEADLNLNYYGLGPLGARALAMALQSDNDTTNLEVEHNGLKAEGVRYLMKMLQKNTTICSLNLSSNQLHHEGAHIVSKRLLDNYYVHSIKLSGNHFDDSAAKCFADALSSDYVLKHLDLSCNKICDKGGEYLGHMIGTNVGIEVLNLSWNFIGACGGVAIGDGLKVNSTLKELDLSFNNFGHMAAVSLGQALKHNSTLVSLDLSSNNIDDQAVTLLCHGLATNNTLNILKLTCNPMTDTGALTLLTTIKNNTDSALEMVDISSVFVYETFVELLEQVHQKSPALTVRYSTLDSVTRNISAFDNFKKFLKERNETVMDFFQDLDKEGTMEVSTLAFIKAVKEAKIPLDQRQLIWLVKKFDEKCTAKIHYSHFA